MPRIGIIETPECWWCGEEEQSVKHLHTKCRRWKKGRREAIRELHTKGIRWQAQTYLQMKKQQDRYNIFEDSGSRRELE